MELEKLKSMISEEEIIDFITALVAIPSYSGLENQEKAAAEYIHKTFLKEGIHSQLIEVKKGRFNVIGALKGTGGGETLLLTGHTDTVPPYDMSDPFTLIEEKGNLYGRGVVDMKGPLACMIFSLIAIKRAELELKGDVIFAGVIDEEEGSLGTIDLIEKGIRADAAIVGEPTDLQICAAHRGLEWFELEFHGKTVHGGKQSEGINAILQASNFIQQCEDELMPKILEETHPLIGTSSMNYGTIQGGTQPSTVAGKCVLEIDRRWVPGVRYGEMVKDFEKLIEDLKQKDPKFQCDFQVMAESVMKEGYIHEAMEIDLNHRILSIVKEKTESIIAETPEITAFPAWSDGGLLSGYSKIPAIVFGPGDLKTAHSKNEHLKKSQVLPGTLIYALTAVDFCSFKGADSVSP